MPSLDSPGKITFFRNSSNECERISNLMKEKNINYIEFFGYEPDEVEILISSKNLMPKSYYLLGGDVRPNFDQFETHCKSHPEMFPRKNPEETEFKKFQDQMSKRTFGDYNKN